MDKRTLELLHSKLSDLDSKIAEISTLRQQIFDILKEHENKHQAEADAQALVAQAKDNTPESNNIEDLDKLQAEVDQTVKEDLADDGDNDAMGAISDIDSERAVEMDSEKAKEDIELEAIRLEAEKLMESKPDDVEPMRQAEESLQSDIDNGSEEGTNSVDLVNNPQTISTIDPTIIPQKVLDEDLDVGKGSDLDKVNDAFAEMDRIESQQDIDKIEEELSMEHDHHDLVAPGKEAVAQASTQAKNEVKNEVKDEDEPVKEEIKAEIKEVSKTQPSVVIKDTVEDASIHTRKDKVEEEEAVFVQPRPIQHAVSAQATHPSNLGTLNAGNPTSGMKVDEMLSRQNSRNLYKAFTLNDKFRFRRELFHGKDVEMAQALDRISIMDNFNQAQDYCYETLGLNPNNEDVKEFMMIIKNHFA